MKDVVDALYECDSILSLLYYREKSSLSEQSRADVKSALDALAKIDGHRNYRVVYAWMDRIRDSQREEIAQEIEAYRDQWCMPQDHTKGWRGWATGFARHGSIPAAWSFLSHAAEIARGKRS